MKRAISLCIMMIAVLCAAAGCSKRETRVDMFYGTSYQLAKELQIYNPEARIGDGPVQGLDGDVGAAVIDRYSEGYAKPAPETESFSVSFEGIETK